MSSKSLVGSVLGVGNPLLDISADADQSLLDKYGLKTNNACLAEEKHLPLYKEMTEKLVVEYTAGGATQNTIRVCQWMLQSPGATAYIGAVGNDEFGQELRSAATKDGVHVAYYVHPSQPTGTCACLIHEKDRSLVANLGAASHYSSEHLFSEEIRPVWEQARVIYSAGFFLSSSPESQLHLAKHANENGKIFMTNLSAPFIPAFYFDQLMAVMPYVDVLFGNESEAVAYAEKAELADKSIEAIALHLHNLPVANPERQRMVVITQGKQCTVVAYDNQIARFAVPYLDPALIVDANGAGDSFVGGFLSQWVQGKSVFKCVRAGHYAARHILQVSGIVLRGAPDFN